MLSRCGLAPLIRARQADHVVVGRGREGLLLTRRVRRHGLAHAVRHSRWCRGFVLHPCRAGGEAHARTVGGVDSCSSAACRLGQHRVSDGGPAEDEEGQPFAFAVGDVGVGLPHRKERGVDPRGGFVLSAEGAGREGAALLVRLVRGRDG